MKVGKAILGKTKGLPSPVSDSGQQLMLRKDMRILQAGMDVSLVNCKNTWSPVSQDLPETVDMLLLCLMTLNK